LVAAAPALLSTPLGTRVAASAAGTTLLAPSATAGSNNTRGGPRRRRRRLEIDRLSLAWGSPVVASGVRIYEAGDSAEPLISAERVSTAEPLLPVARALLAVAGGGRPVAVGGGMGSARQLPSVNVSVTNPIVDASLRESRDGGGFRVVALFGGAGDSAGGGAASSSSSPSSSSSSSPSPLSVADAAASFSADLVLGDTLSVCVSDGLLRLPAAMAEALVGDSGAGGDGSSGGATKQPPPHRHVHVVAVAGERAVRDAAAPDGERLLARSPEVETAAAELGIVGMSSRHAARQQQQPKQSTPSPDSPLFPLDWLSTNPAAAAAAAEGAPLPAPFAAQLFSPRCAAEARGWWVLPPGKEEAYYVLERPAIAAVELTPELASRTLARANPLLQGAVGLVAEGGGQGRRAAAAAAHHSSQQQPPPRLSVSYAPEGGLLPADRARVSVAPARVAVQIAGITGAPATGAGRGAATTTTTTATTGGVGLPPQAHQSTPTAAVGIAAALLELCGVRAIGARGEVLEARVERMDVDVDGDVFETRRVRVALAGPGGGGAGRSGSSSGPSVSVALWGRYDAQSDQVAMRVGLPARAALTAVLPKRVLDRLPVAAGEGATEPGDPDPPLLTLDIAGPAEAPRADWGGAARQLASLSAGAAISAAFSGGGGAELGTS
jgi:hypothetical protein